jgi:hypothetical protein
LTQVFLKKETLELSEHALDTIGRSPTLTLLASLILILFNHVKTNVVVEHIWVRNFSVNCDGWGMMRIAQGEPHLQVENTSFIESSFRASDVGMPNENVIL